MRPGAGGNDAAFGKGLLLGLAVLLSAGVRAEADTVTLAPVRDNSLIQDVDGARSNGSGPGVFVGRNSGGSLRRGLVAFDVASGVPAGSRVQAATLTLYVSNVSDSTLRSISLHRVLGDWGEGASTATGGSGAPSEPGDATWIHRFYPDSLWIAPGGDFAGEVAGAVEVGDVGFYSWSGPGLVADVQFWVDHPELDFGWLLSGDETANGTAKRFDSRESPDPGNRPSLQVTFTPSGAPVRGATWGRMKTRYRTDPLRNPRPRPSR